MSDPYFDGVGVTQVAEMNDPGVRRVCGLKSKKKRTVRDIRARGCDLVILGRKFL